MQVVFEVASHISRSGPGVSAINPDIHDGAPGFCSGPLARHAAEGVWLWGPEFGPLRMRYGGRRALISVSAALDSAGEMAGGAAYRTPTAHAQLLAQYGVAAIAVGNPQPGTRSGHVWHHGGSVMLCVLSLAALLRRAGLPVDFDGYKQLTQMPEEALRSLLIGDRMAAYEAWRDEQRSAQMAERARREALGQPAPSMLAILESIQEARERDGSAAAHSAAVDAARGAGYRRLGSEIVEQGSPPLVTAEMGGVRFTHPHVRAPKLPEQLARGAWRLDAAVWVLWEGIEAVEKERAAAWRPRGQE